MGGERRFRLDPVDGDAATVDDECVIRLSGVKKAFDEREILRGVDLDVRRGETLVIMGGSGCGKSTVLRHMIGVLSPDETSATSLTMISTLFDVASASCFSQGRSITQ